MLKKRIVAVITVRRGLAVQSFGYQRYLPIGKPEVLAENFDRWGADEILLHCIDRSTQGMGPDFDLLTRVAEKGLGTPLIYGGGISTTEQGIQAVKLGADRICLDAALTQVPKVVLELSEKLGAQALIGAVPLSMNRDECQWLNHINGENRGLQIFEKEFLSQRVLSEVLIIDWKNEGLPGGFNFQILEKFPYPELPIIAFGGLSDSAMVQKVFEYRQVVAAAIGNFLSYREHAVLQIKEQLFGVPIRIPSVRGI